MSEFVRGRSARVVGGHVIHEPRVVSAWDLLLDVSSLLAAGVCLVLLVPAFEPKEAAAAGEGHPGVMVITGLRCGPSLCASTPGTIAAGKRIPVGTFTDRDGTVTNSVAWQDSPVAVGDRMEGVRVGNRAWATPVQLAVGDVLIPPTIVGLFVWRALALLLHLLVWWRGRRPAGG